MQRQPRVMVVRDGTQGGAFVCRSGCNGPVALTLFSRRIACIYDWNGPVAQR